MSRTDNRYLDDVPATPAEFDFDLIGAALAEVLDQPMEGATVIGIHGPWGSGKTTLMYAIRDALKREENEQGPIVVEFNAWKYQAREALWRALILRLVAELRQRTDSADELDQLEASLYRAFEVQEAGPWSINWRNAATEVASVALEVLQLGGAGRLLQRIFGKRRRRADEPLLNGTDVERISGLIERETVSRHLAQVQSIEQFLGAFRDLVAELGREGQQIVVLVDDLDRCLPEAALEVFEAIKLFLDAPGCGFVVAVDREVIRSGLAVRYASAQGARPDASVADADEYIEKTIGISYDVPRLSTQDVEALIDDAQLPLKLNTEQKLLIGSSLGRNPRRVKRFLNLLSVQVNLASLAARQGHSVPKPLRGNGDDAALSLLLKTMLVGYRYPLLLRRGDDLSLLFEVELAIAQFDKDSASDRVKARAALDEKFAGMPAAIAARKSDRALWHLMRLGPELRSERHRKALSTHINWIRRTGAETSAGDVNPDEP